MGRPRRAQRPRVVRFTDASGHSRQENWPESSWICAFSAPCSAFVDDSGEFSPSRSDPAVMTYRMVPMIALVHRFFWRRCRCERDPSHAQTVEARDRRCPDGDGDMDAKLTHRTGYDVYWAIADRDGRRRTVTEGNVGHCDMPERQLRHGPVPLREGRPSTPDRKRNSFRPCTGRAFASSRTTGRFSDVTWTAFRRSGPGRGVANSGSTSMRGDRYPTGGLRAWCWVSGRPHRRQALFGLQPSLAWHLGREPERVAGLDGATAGLLSRSSSFRFLSMPRRTRLRTVSSDMTVAPDNDRDRLEPLHDPPRARPGLPK